MGSSSDRQQSYASKYNGLQASLSRRFSHGFMFKANYTWSKALDNTDCCSGNIYNPIPNTYNGSSEWGRSSFDAEQNFIADYVWEIPFLLNRTDLVGKTLGGWQLSGITTFQSGLPNDIGDWQRSGRRRKHAGAASPGSRQSEPRLWEPHGRRMVQSREFALPTIGTFATTARNFMSIPGHQQLGHVAVQDVQAIRKDRTAIPRRCVQSVEPHRIRHGRNNLFDAQPSSAKLSPPRTPGT